MCVCVIELETIYTTHNTSEDKMNTEQSSPEPTEKKNNNERKEQNNNMQQSTREDKMRFSLFDDVYDTNSV